MHFEQVVVAQACTKVDLLEGYQKHTAYEGSNKDRMTLKGKKQSCLGRGERERSAEERFIQVMTFSVLLFVCWRLQRSKEQQVKAKQRERDDMDAECARVLQYSVGGQGYILEDVMCYVYIYTCCMYVQDQSKFLHQCS